MCNIYSVVNIVQMYMYVGTSKHNTCVVLIHIYYICPPQVFIVKYFIYVVGLKNKKGCDQKGNTSRQFNGTTS